MRRKQPKTAMRSRMAMTPLMLSLSLLPVSGAFAQKTPAGDKSVPALAKARPLELPQVVQQTLPNGMKLVVLEDHKQPAVWIRLALPAGSLRDPKDKVGLATMTARLLDKGTTTRTESQIADTIDGLGASLGASAGDDFLTVSASGLSAHADTLFSLLADITLHPIFPEEELARTRTQTINEIGFSLSQPGTVADAALSRLVYGAHPYGNFSAGTPKTLTGLTHDDLVKFHDTYFAPNQATLFLVGDITPAQAMEKAQAAFGSWEKKDVPAPPAPPVKPPLPADSAKPQITLIDRPGAAQTEIRIGTLTSGYNDPNRMVGTVATAVLGLGQFEGRLTKEIRVKRGLTYGAASFFNRHKDAGNFEISTYTKNASTAEVVKLALEEARKISAGEVPADELQDRKTFLQGSFAVSVATPNGVLSRLVPAVLYGAGPGDLTRYTERIQAVTGSQIPEIMRNLHLNAPQIVLVGDAKAIQKDVQPLGTLKVIPFASVDLQSPTLEGSRGQGTGNSGNTTTPKASPAELAEGRSRLAATIKAHGGDAFLNVKTIVLKGKGVLNDPTGQLPGAIPIETLTIQIVSPDKVRADLQALFPILFGTEGGTSVPWLTASGMDIPPPGGLETALNPVKLLRDAYVKNFAVTPLPKTADAKEIGYTIFTEMGVPVRMYVDATTNLANRVVMSSKNGDVTVTVGSYKTAQGVQLPGKLKVDMGKATLLDLTFNDVTVNVPIDNTIFAKPKAP